MPKRANNEGTIYKKTIRKGDKEYTYWESQVTVGYDPGTGKRIRKAFTGKSQKEVRQKMQDASVSVESKTFFEPSTATMKDWLKVWLEEYCANIKYNTKRNYSNVINNHLIPYIGATKLSALNLASIQAHINKLSETLSPRSIRLVYMVINSALNKAVELDYIKTNPAKKVVLPKLTKNEIKPLTNKQLSSFIAASQSSPYRVAYMLMAFTGLRVSEALGLTWDCIDFDKGAITITQQLIHRPAKDGGSILAPLKNDRPRYLFAPIFILDLLKARKAEQNRDRIAAGSSWCSEEEQFVFTNKLGCHVERVYVYKDFKRLASEIGIPNSTVHDLRHTYAVLALQNGDPIKTVQDNLGHATASFTLDVYGHTTDLMRKDSASRMHDFFTTITSQKNGQSNA